jgi:hypothetical protein
VQPKSIRINISTLKMNNLRGRAFNIFILRVCSRYSSLCYNF